jgi:AAA domain
MERQAVKYFNTAGPIKPDIHYYIPVSQRVDLDEIMMLIGGQKYFVLHAPRQSGKTTALLELCRLLNESGKYRCLYINVESAQTARENVAEAMTVIVNTLMDLEKIHLPGDPVMGKVGADLLHRSPTSALAAILRMWSHESALPTVLLIDEIDSLVGDTLVSILRQLRSGYNDRPKNFPQSVILCGVRDVRDYRIHASSEKEIITGGSCFNIKAESLRIGNFSPEEVRELYLQHTEATGQVFTPEAVTMAYDFTQGQPWLVNALAYEACFKIKVGKNRQNPITPDLIREAKENLVKGRVTHLDQLADKLKEPRVRRIMEPMVLGEDITDFREDDADYLKDLGLIVRTPDGLKIANPIYQEVIPRQLTLGAQLNMEPRIDRLWYIHPDGSIAVEKLLTDFQKFFRENSESWIQRFDYQEAGPQLLLQAYLQRVINGGGRIDREYGLGRMRTDLLLVWPYVKDGVKCEQRVVFELKIQHKGREATITEGLRQISLYLDRVGEKHGHLLIFDRDPQVSWDDKVFREEMTTGPYAVTVWGM